MAESFPVLAIRGLARGFNDGERDVQILDGVELDVRAGESVAIMGASGCGKSTLLHLAAGMDQPDQGEVRVAGEPLQDLPEPQRTRQRARLIGLVFQDFNLVESLSAAENIELAEWLSQRPSGRENEDRRRQLVEELGLADLLDRLPNQLSGGEQQRVAIARALVHAPALVLADEPTGSLDRVTGERVMDVLINAAKARGCALVVVTHSEEDAARCDRTLALRDGRLAERPSA